MQQLTTTPQGAGASATALVPRNIQEALELAKVMAAANLIPEHLHNKPGDCLLIVMQAQRWGMDAVSVAQCTSVVRGKLCYEGKLVAAALYAMGAIEGRLRYEFSGSGEGRKVRVIGRPRGTDQDQAIEGTVLGWKTDNGNWKKDPDSMLIYRGTRQWARLYAPEALLGVYTPDELEEDPSVINGTATVIDPKPEPQRPAYPVADFEANLPKWHAAIAKGLRTADEIIALAETKGTLNEEQKRRVREVRQPEEEGAE